MAYIVWRVFQFVSRFYIRPSFFKLNTPFIQHWHSFFNFNIRFFNLDSGFLSSTFVLFKCDVRVLMSIYLFLLKRDICFQFVIRFSLNIIRFKKQMTKSSRLNKTNVELK